MPTTRHLVYAALALGLFAASGCTRSSPDDSALVLRHGLDAYLAGGHEPVDDKDNMARMYNAVLDIREKRRVDAIPVLLDVFLMYDATDNNVAEAARMTLLQFGYTPERLKEAAFDAKFEDATELFAEISLPNSMARPEGFDLDAHITRLRSEFADLAWQFRTEEGIRYLGQRLGNENDELNVHCGIEIMARSQETTAVPVLEYLIQKPPAQLAADEQNRVTGAAKLAIARLQQPSAR